MKLVFDSDASVHALRIPTKPKLLDLHKKASRIFESCITKKNELFLPSVVIIEVSAVLSKILRKEIAKDGIDKLLLTAEEIYPITLDMLLDSIYAISSNQYFQKSIDNALNLSKIDKDERDNDVPGWKESKTQVRIGGMDILILTYTQMKNAVLITNDWSLWYVAWKSGINSYWLSGLSKEQISKITDGFFIEYPP